MAFHKLWRTRFDRRSGPAPWRLEIRILLPDVVDSNALNPGPKSGLHLAQIIGPRPKIPTQRQAGKWYPEVGTCARFRGDFLARFPRPLMDHSVRGWSSISRGLRLEELYAAIHGLGVAVCKDVRKSGSRMYCMLYLHELCVMFLWLGGAVRNDSQACRS